MTLTVEPFFVDSAARHIDVGGRLTHLSPKAMAVLTVLCDAQGAVVTRDDLLASVWPDVHVGEEVLTQAIAELRRALGDKARTPRYIETIAKSGYRLIVLPQMRARRASMAASARTVGAEQTEPTPCSSPSVVVVPFEPLTGGPQGELLANGLSRDLATSLARTRWLFVSARASAAALSATHTEPLEIAQPLGVRYAVWGSIIVSDGRLRVMVSLCDSQTRSLVWAERYDRSMQDLFGLLDDVGQEIALRVETEIERHLRNLARTSPIEALDAWGLFHRAASSRYAARADAIEDAGQMLRQASRLAPHSARIRAASASLEIRRQMFLAPRGNQDALGRACEMAHEAVSLDAHEPEAQVALGRALGMAGQGVEGLQWLEEAVRTNPSSFSARNFLAWSLLFDNQGEAAIEQMTFAERISPMDPISYNFHTLRAQALALDGDMDAALHHSERATLHPNANDQITAIAAWCAAAAGQGHLARRHAQRLLRSRPDFVSNDFFAWFRFEGTANETIRRALSDAGVPT